eukprot:12328020-Prorocentrum_lima.AAC.1
MTSSLVGSEMCIRDRKESPRLRQEERDKALSKHCESQVHLKQSRMHTSCLLYTSDAADDM